MTNFNIISLIPVELTILVITSQPFLDSFLTDASYGM